MPEARHRQAFYRESQKVILPTESIARNAAPLVPRVLNEQIVEAAGVQRAIALYRIVCASRYSAMAPSGLS
jgi:hypothetical protein